MNFHERPDQRMTRRALLTRASVLGASFSFEATTAHELVGTLKPPLAAPSVALAIPEGKPARFDRLLKGSVTAVQLMFTGCSATCPIQGALFADLQQALAGAPRHWRMLSVSIDPLGDDSKSMLAWMKQFGAQSDRWSAAVPFMSDLDRLLDFLKGRASGSDRHTPQVYIFDAEARLRYRTPDMPPSSMVIPLMKAFA